MTERLLVAARADDLRLVLGAIGGIDGLTVALAEGSVDLVTFDSQDPSRMLATTRLAVRRPASPDVGETWQIIDTDIASWLERAVAPAGATR